MSSRRQRNIPLGGRYRQVSLYKATWHKSHLPAWHREAYLWWAHARGADSTDVILPTWTCWYRSANKWYSRSKNGKIWIFKMILKFFEYLKTRAWKWTYAMCGYMIYIKRKLLIRIRLPTSMGNLDGDAPCSDKLPWFETFQCISIKI